MRRLMLPVLMLLLPTAVEAARVSVTVGSNVGLAGEEPLQYAEADARRIHDTLIELGGVSQDKATLLLHPTAVTLRDTLGALRGAGATEVFFYFSGHGTESALHTAGEAIPIAKLRQQLEQVGAELTVVVLDSCRTSALIKGARLIQVPFVIAQPRTASGLIEIRAAAEGQPAQESQALRAAVFSHFWASALRGAADVNHDGVVTLHEAYDYTFSGTVAKTAGTRNVQRPSAHEVLQHQNPVALTQVTADAVQVGAPAGPGTYFIFTLPQRNLVGELTAGQRLFVPRGRYEVIYRSDEGAFIGSIDLRDGRSWLLDPRILSPIPEQTLAARGANTGGTPWRLALGLGGKFVIGAADSAGGMAQAEVSFLGGVVRPGLQIEYAVAPLRVVNGGGIGHQWLAHALLDFIVFRRFVWIALRAYAGGALGVQHLTHDGLPASSLATHYGAVSVGGGLSIESPITGGWGFVAQLLGGALVRPEAPGNALTARFVVGTTAGVAWEF